MKSEKIGLFLNKILKYFDLQLNYSQELSLLINPIEEDKYFNKLFKLTIGRSLVSKEKLFILYQCMIAISKLNGDLVELGVYKGGSAKFLSYLAMKICSHKNLFLLDSFKGLPEINPKYDILKKGDFGETNFDTVKAFLRNCNNIEILNGFFSNTLHKLQDKLFCFVHIDVDIYSSITECCEFFYPRMINGGIMIFDDYGCVRTPGAKIAVDNFFKDKIEAPIYLPSGHSIVYRIKRVK